MQRFLGLVTVGFAAVALFGCGDDGGDGSTPMAGQAAPTTGAAGTNPATGAAGTNPTTGAAGTNPTTGAAGTNPTTGAAGTNPAMGAAGTNPTTGAAGMNTMNGAAGTNPAAGAAGTGTAGMGTMEDPCAEDSGLTGAALHDAVAMFLGTEPGSCNGRSCHDSAGPPRSGLLLAGVTDMSTLVGTMSCEAPNVPLVAANDPEGSYLWQKLYAAEVDATGVIEPEESWEGPGNCASEQAVGTYGVRMPLGIGSGTIAHERLVEICDWIQAGAPGPNG